MRALLFLLFIGFALTACDSFTTESESEIAEDVGNDVVAPFIVNSFPETEGSDFEVDSTVRFTFSELMNIEILENPFTTDLVKDINADADADGITESFSSGVVLYSGVSTVGNTFQVADERPRHIDYSVKLGVGVDPITNNDIDIDATAFTLQHESGRFALNTQYTVLISEHVVDLADDPKTDSIIEGNSLGRNIELSFNTEEGEWKDNVTLGLRKKGASVGESELIEGDQFEPKLASNATGDALAVWRQNNSSGANDTIGVWGSRYSPSDNRWVLSGVAPNDGAEDISAERIDDSSLVANAFGPKVAINYQGKAVATWYQAPNGSDVKSIWVNVFDQPTPPDANGENQSINYEWKGAKDIRLEQLVVDDTSSPEVGIDDEGNILIVWLEIEADVKLLKARYYNVADQQLLYNDPDNELVDKTIILNDTLGGDAKQPTLNFSSDGEAVVAWSQEESGVFQIYSSRLLGSSWSEPAQLNLSDLPSEQFSGATNPIVAVDNNSDAIVIWEQHDGKRENIWLSRFSGGVWGGAVKMEDDDIGDASDPYVVFGSENQAFAIWGQAKRVNGILSNSILVRYYSLNTGWEPIIELSNASEFSKPTVGIDFEGNAIATWLNDGKVVRSRYSNLTSSWSGAVVSNPGVISAQSLGLVPLLQDGRFISVWTEFKDGSFKLISALFSD